MKNLHTQLPGGLSIASVLAATEEQLGKLIYPVGFWRRKSTYLKLTAAVLQEKYGGDVPLDLKPLLALPGVGIKMATIYRCVEGKIAGIGVDTHVHRICNRLHWVKTTTPEATQRELEAWLPQHLWLGVNVLLVGFGQQICLPRGPRCPTCLNNEICPSAFKANSPPKRKNKKITEQQEELAEELEEEELEAPQRRRQQPARMDKAKTKKKPAKRSKALKREDEDEDEDGNGSDSGDDDDDNNNNDNDEDWTKSQN